MAGPMVVVVLSAGRCGTRWLATGLSELYGDALDAEHQPIGARYAPRRFFRRYDDPEAVLEVPEVARHINRIESARKPYVETGWPLFAALPLLATRLADRLRVVHLTRHPVPSALSHFGHRTYAGSERDDAYTRLATLAPDDANVFQPQYAWTWDQLSAFEKCLFWWSEIHQFGLEFPGRFDQIPLLRLKAEELITVEPYPSLHDLLDFIGLPWHERWRELAARGPALRRWRHYSDREVDPLQVHRHPATVEIARELGYDLSGLTPGRLQAEYCGG